MFVADCPATAYGTYYSKKSAKEAHPKIKWLKLQEVKISWLPSKDTQE